jgi:hypothetical protein
MGAIPGRSAFDSIVRGNRILVGRMVHLRTQPPQGKLFVHAERNKNILWVKGCGSGWRCKVMWKALHSSLSAGSM